MSMSAALLPEVDQQVRSTRRVPQRVPADRRAWRPHQKARALGPLASHIADIPRLPLEVLEKDSLDVAPQGAAPRRPAPAVLRQEILERFDSNIAAAREALAGAAD